MANYTPNNKSSKKAANKKTPVFGKKTVKTTAPVKEVPAAPAEWLYCAVTAVDAAMIADACEKAGFAGVEYWQEADVVEIPIGEKASMDMELIECDLEDEIGNAFLEENHVTCLYMVTIVPSCFEKAFAAMRLITEAFGGFFCGDTEDFTPVVK